MCGGGGYTLVGGGEEQVKLYPYKKGEMENKLAMLKGGEGRKRFGIVLKQA